MNLGIEGKVALVLGSSSGLGFAVARRLAQEGATVVVTGRTPETVEGAAEQIRADGGDAHSMAFDLSDLDATHRAVSRLEADVGAVDILFNNSGGPAPSGALEVPPEQWRRHFDAMVLSLITVTAQLVPGMVARGWGRIITSTSSGVIAPIEGLAVSNTLRPALVAWSKSLARELGPSGVTANIIVPGRIATLRVESLDRGRADRQKSSVESVRDASLAQIPLGRYGHPEEFASAVAFLAGTPASYITGSIVRVDGGLIASV